MINQINNNTHRHTRNTSNSNFMKFASIAIAAVIVICYITANFGNQFAEENVGAERTIQYEVVNIRDGHSLNADVITTFNEGSHVILTGNEYHGLGERHSSWVEIQLRDGTTGWCVVEAISAM